MTPKRMEDVLGLLGPEVFLELRLSASAVGQAVAEDLIELLQAGGQPIFMRKSDQRKLEAMSIAARACGTDEERTIIVRLARHLDRNEYSEFLSGIASRIWEGLDEIRQLTRYELQQYAWVQFMTGWV